MAARGCFWLRCVMTYAVFSFTSTRSKRLRCGLPWKPYLVCERVWLTRASNVLTSFRPGFLQLQTGLGEEQTEP